MFLDFAALLFFLVVLGKSADIVVDNVSIISRFFRISKLAIGFLLVALTTSFPEFTISVISSISGEGEIAVGNVFGSNVANILLILGFGALIYGVKLADADLTEIRLVLASTFGIVLILLILSFLRFPLENFGGILLLICFCIYCIYSLKKQNFSEDLSNNIQKSQAVFSFFVFFMGIILVLISSSLVVRFAINLAQGTNFSEGFIGSTLVAIGTSLPELSTTLSALRKKEYSLALGDAIGSNLVNLTLVLGSSALLQSTSVLFLPIFIFAMVFALLTDVLAFFFSSYLKELNKFTGILFLILYLVYLIILFNFQFHF